MMKPDKWSLIFHLIFDAVWGGWTVFCTFREYNDAGLTVSFVILVALSVVWACLIYHEVYDYSVQKKFWKLEQRINKLEEKR